MVLLSLDSGQGMHPNSLDKVRVRAVGPSWSQRATSNVPGNRGGLKKSKDKGKRSKQRRIAKRRNERPSTHPEKNRQRPPDHQARRRSRKETLTQVAQNGRKRVIGQHEEKTQWMRTAKKVQQRKPAPPMRKNRPEQKKYQKNRDSF